MTAEVVSGRRSENLVSLATSLAEAPDSDALANAIAEFLGTTLKAKASVARLADQELKVLVGEEREAGGGVTVVSSPDSDADLMAQAARRNETIYERTDSADIGEFARLAVPVRSPTDRSSVVGALCVRWPFGKVVSQNTRLLLETTSSVAGLAWARIELVDLAARDIFRSALDSMLDNVAICTAIRNADGSIVDFEIQFTNAASIDGAGRNAEQLTGQRVRALSPAWRESGMFDSFVRVVETGEPFVGRRLAYHDVLDDGSEISGYWTVQATKLADGYIAASRDETALVESERLAEQAGRERAAVELLQRAALPGRAPRLNGVELGLHYRPANRGQPIGGDWYDAFRLDDSRAALVIADVSGHGTESAAFMVQVRNVIRTLALEHMEPELVMARANQITSSFERDDWMFVTCCYGVVDAERRTFRWSVAGHPPPLLQRGDGSADLLISRPGAPLAIDLSTHYRTAEAELSAGDRLLLYTDGLVERRGEVIDVGFERLRARLLSVRHLDPQQAAESLGRSVDEPEDDIAVLCADLTAG